VLRVLVGVSNRWTDAAAIRAELAAFPAATTVILQASATGADNLAIAIARDLGLACESYALSPVERGIYGWQGPQRIAERALEDGKPDLVLAFRLGRSGGIARLIREAKRRAIPVKIVDGAGG
jgi:hypothetical protein